MNVDRLGTIWVLVVDQAEKVKANPTVDEVMTLQNLLNLMLPACDADNAMKQLCIQMSEQIEVFAKLIRDVNLHWTCVYLGPLYVMAMLGLTGIVIAQDRRDTFVLGLSGQPVQSPQVTSPVPSPARLPPVNAQSSGRSFSFGDGRGDRSYRDDARGERIYRGDGRVDSRVDSRGDTYGNQRSYPTRMSPRGGRGDVNAPRPERTQGERNVEPKPVSKYDKNKERNRLREEEKARKQAEKAAKKIEKIPDTIYDSVITKIGGDQRATHPIDAPMNPDEPY